MLSYLTETWGNVIEIIDFQNLVMIQFHSDLIADYRYHGPKYWSCRCPLSYCFIPTIVPFMSQIIFAYVNHMRNETIGFFFIMTGSFY